MQRRALKIAYPSMSYDAALQESNIKTLSARREDACLRLIASLRDHNSPYNPLTAIVETSLSERTHNYDLRNNNPERPPIMSERFKNFFTIKYS
jgi:hypothetical protein